MGKDSNIAIIDKDINIVPNNIEDIKGRIYTVRGKQVMLDSDVAMLYHYQTKRINEAVTRNKERFPENFCFQLTEDEFSGLRLQIVSLLENEDMRSQFATA